MTPLDAIRRAVDALDDGRLGEAHRWFGLAADLRAAQLGAPGTYEHADLQLAMRGRRLLAELRAVVAVARVAGSCSDQQLRLPWGKEV